VGLLNNIREKLGYKLLNKKLKRKKRKVVVTNLDDAQTVGVIFNATNQDSYDRAYRFSTFLMSKDIKVFAMGYVDDMHMLKYFAEKKSFKFFSRNNFNWYGKPKNPSIDFFIEKKFDILIDLSLDTFFPVNYIVASSEAFLKVGRMVDDCSYYDIMFDIKKEPTLDHLINQIELYLSILNVKTSIR